MSVQFASESHSFSGKGTLQGVASFPTNVLSATAVLQGIDATYDGDDHHLKNLQVIVSNVSFNANTVTYDVTFDINDNDGHYMSGTVMVAVMAETE